MNCTAHSPLPHVPQRFLILGTPYFDVGDSKIKNAIFCIFVSLLGLDRPMSTKAVQINIFGITLIYIAGVCIPF